MPSIRRLLFSSRQCSLRWPRSFRASIVVRTVSRWSTAITAAARRYAPMLSPEFGSDSSTKAWKFTAQTRQTDNVVSSLRWLCGGWNEPTAPSVLSCMGADPGTSPPCCGWWDAGDPSGSHPRFTAGGSGASVGFARRQHAWRAAGARVGFRSLRCPGQPEGAAIAAWARRQCRVDVTDLDVPHDPGDLDEVRGEAPLASRSCGEQTGGAHEPSDVRW